jgi:hypothetical protein
LNHDEQRRIAILIGWDNYEHLPKLRTPLRDIAAMEQLLSDPAIGFFSEVTVFREGEEAHAILSSIETLITEEAGPQDLILIYFSGHGKLDTLGHLYLATKRTKDSALDSTSIDIDRIRKYLDRGRSQSAVLVLDCCYSGAVKHAFAKGAITDALNQQAMSSGLSILTSSTEFQESFELAEDDQSLFTKMLVDGISTGYADADNDGLITVDDAFTYAQNAVRGTGIQQPTRMNLNVTGHCVLARNRHYKPAERPGVENVSPEFIGAYMAVEHMVNATQRKDALPYFVALNGYWIEGFPYSASGLSVDLDRTPNMRQLQDGFECDTWFESHMILPATLRLKEIVKRSLPDGRSVNLVKVRLHVRLEDICVIAAFKDGQQIDLFMDEQAFARKFEFFAMTQKFFGDLNNKAGES